MAANALLITEIPESYRDEGVPRRRSRTHQLACDATFNRYSSHWLLGESSLDSSYAAIEALAQLPGSEGHLFVKRHRGDFSRLLANHFAGGIFRADGSIRTRGIFACHAAIGIMKCLEDIPCEPFLPLHKRSAMALTCERYDELVRNLPGIELHDCPPHEHVIQLIRESALASPIRGGLVDHPESELPPTLTVLYTASNVLWNLFPDEGIERFFELVDEHGVRRFLERCLREATYESTDIAGFTVHPASTEICANTTFFGLKLVERLGLWDLLLDSHIHRGILNFYLCFSYKDGGFASTLQEGRSVNATFLSLRALGMLMPGADFTDFVGAEAHRIRDFVWQCSDADNGGARFAPDADSFVENCLATRYRLQILDLISQISGKRLSDDLIKDTLRFLTSCYRENDGFHAYAPGRLEVNIDNPRAWLEDYLDRRDRTLRAALSQPELERELEIDRAYAELEELHQHRSDEGAGSELDDRISGVQKHLRELQEEEARRLRRQALQALADRGIDLEGGKRRLAEARALLAQNGISTTPDSTP